MALDELRKDIERDAEEEAARLGKEADNEYKRIIDEAKGRADEAMKKAKSDAIAESEQKRNDVTTALEIEMGSMLSSAKEECISREMKSLIVSLKSALGGKQDRIISTALESFSESVPLHQTIAKLDKKHANAIKTPVAKTEYSNINGIILASIDGKVTANATIEGIIESNGELIRRALATRLFE